jgi:aspartate/methionine/tyrosine aminotransferase
MTLDLSVGEPVFLQQTLLPTLERLSQEICFPQRYGYPSPEGLPELISEIRGQVDYKYIVPTVGARQGLSVALRALDCHNRVFHSGPRYPGLREIAVCSGLHLIKNEGPERGTTATIVDTIPNNPDGRTWSAWSKVNVLDRAYCSPVYYDGDLNLPGHDVAVFSASKMLGASHVRVGWCATNDEDVYHRLLQSVKMETHGVSAIDQQYVAGLLAVANNHNHKDELDVAVSKARQILLENSLAFLEQLGDHVENPQGAVDGVGMFIWFKPRFDPLDPTKFIRALGNAGVSMWTNSGSFGEGLQDYIRCSVGNDMELTKDAFRRIRAELESTREVFSDS